MLHKFLKKIIEKLEGKNKLILVAGVLMLFFVFFLGFMLIRTFFSDKNKSIQFSTTPSSTPLLLEELKIEEVKKEPSVLNIEEVEREVEKEVRELMRARNFYAASQKIDEANKSGLSNKTLEDLAADNLILSNINKEFSIIKDAYKNLKDPESAILLISSATDIAELAEISLSDDSLCITKKEFVEIVGLERIEEKEKEILKMNAKAKTPFILRFKAKDVNDKPADVRLLGYINVDGKMGLYKIELVDASQKVHFMKVIDAKIVLNYLISRSRR